MNLKVAVADFDNFAAELDCRQVKVVVDYCRLFEHYCFIHCLQKVLCCFDFNLNR